MNLEKQISVRTAKIFAISTLFMVVGSVAAIDHFHPAKPEVKKVPTPGPTVTETVKIPVGVHIPEPGPTVTKKVEVTVRPPSQSSRSTNRKPAVAVPRGSVQSQAQAVFGSQYSCAASLISHESGWNVHATNPSSGAYGLPQALPASKLASAGSDWRDSAHTQLIWMRNYVNSRYGGACAAWSFWQSHSSY